MSTVQGRLRIAVQKSGRLSDRSLDLVRDAGLRVVKGNNDLLYRVENYPIDLLRVRDDDIPTFVADGVCDLGIVGENVLEEARNGGPVAEIIMPLGFGRCTLKLAGPPTLPDAGPASAAGPSPAPHPPQPLPHRPSPTPARLRGGAWPSPPPIRRSCAAGSPRATSAPTSSPCAARSRSPPG